jgi:hypothetical protein
LKVQNGAAGKQESWWSQEDGIAARVGRHFL